MHHDFIGSNTRNVRRDRNGRSCYGYMDYRQDTNYWSTCNVEYLTRQNKNCLKKLGGGDNNPDKPSGKFSCKKDNSPIKLRYLNNHRYNLINWSKNDIKQEIWIIKSDTLILQASKVIKVVLR